MIYKLISLVDLINNIDFEKINCMKNGISYIKDILSISNYELVDLVGSGVTQNFNLVFCNSHGVILPSSQKIYKELHKIYKDKETPRLMICELIHNHLKPNNQYTNMRFFYGYNSEGPYYFKSLHCVVDDIGNVSDIKIDGVYCATRLEDLFSSFAFLLVKGR